MTIERNNFWQISEGYHMFMYVFAAIAMVIFAYGFYRRFKLWMCGRKVKIYWKDVKSNLFYFYTMVVSQKKVKRDKLYGIMHRATSYGFVILFIGTCLVFIDSDLGIHILQGKFYLLYELVLDTFGVFFTLGLFIAIIIRIKKKRGRLKNGRMDHFFLWLFVFISVGGFILEGIRIAEAGTSYSHWAPIGYGLSLLMKDLPGFTADAYPLWWMGHAILAFILIAIIPYTKLFHFLTAPLNILFQPVKRTGKIALPYDFESLTEVEKIKEAEVYAVKQVSDFTGWQLLSTDACTECGRCDSLCPAVLSEKPLSPRTIVTKIRDHMEPSQEILSFITAEELQSCTTCGACVEACPVSINHIDLILSMRRGLIKNSILEEQAENMFINVEEQQNIWGKPWSDRNNWSRGLDIPTLDERNGE